MARCSKCTNLAIRVVEWVECQENEIHHFGWNFATQKASSTYSDRTPNLFTICFSFILISKDQRFLVEQTAWNSYWKAGSTPLKTSYLLGLPLPAFRKIKTFQTSNWLCRRQASVDDKSQSPPLTDLEDSQRGRWNWSDFSMCWTLKWTW